MTDLISPQPFPIRLSSFTAALSLGSRSIQRLLDWIPPSGLVILSCIAIQMSTAVSKSLFETIGVFGTAFLCKGMAAILLSWIERNNLKSALNQSRSYRDYMLVVGLGLSIAIAVMGVYAAVARIPMGIASTLEFVGPLGVAVLGSRRLLHLVWVALAAIGVLLLNPVSYPALDGSGVGFALLAGIGWGSYIVLSSKAGRIFPGRVGLALAMMISTLIMLPFGIAQLSRAITPEVILIGLGVASLGTLLPYSFEYTALKRLPSRIFGTLMSIEPAIAAIVGFIFLNEVLSLQMVIAILLVTIAAAGSSVSESS